MKLDKRPLGSLHFELKAFTQWIKEWQGAIVLSLCGIKKHCIQQMKCGTLSLSLLNGACRCRGGIHVILGAKCETNSISHTLLIHVVPKSQGKFIFCWTDVSHLFIGPYGKCQFPSFHVPYTVYILALATCFLLHPNVPSVATSVLLLNGHFPSLSHFPTPLKARLKVKKR